MVFNSNFFICQKKKSIFFIAYNKSCRINFFSFQISIDCSLNKFYRILMDFSDKKSCLTAWDLLGFSFFLSFIVFIISIISPCCPSPYSFMSLHLKLMDFIKTPTFACVSVLKLFWTLISWKWPGLCSF